jgi:hypothetical protein
VRRALPWLFAGILAGVPWATAAADLTLVAPPSLAAAAERVREVDLPQLARRLARAGLTLPARLDVTLIPEPDPRARDVPRWIVGLASGQHDIVVFPQRVLPYPYDSLESVVRHEIAHLALTERAGGNTLPRWFHEGVAVSVDSGWGTSGQLRLLVAMLADPATGDLARLFASNTQPESVLGYGLSVALVADVQRRHGAGVPGAIAARVAAGMSFDRAFEAETGERPDAAAARAWAAFRTWTRWVPAVTSTSTLWAAILALAFVAYRARLRRRVRRRRQWDEEEGSR